MAPRRFSHEAERLPARGDADAASERGAHARRALNLGALGLGGESGEVIDLIKKHLFHDAPLDTEELKKELGDVLWYLSAIATGVGLTLEEVAEANVAKLLARYGRVHAGGGEGEGRRGLMFREFIFVAESLILATEREVFALRTARLEALAGEMSKAALLRQRDAFHARWGLFWKCPCCGSRVEEGSLEGALLVLRCACGGVAEQAGYSR